jgi:hypothetical protein
MSESSDATRSDVAVASPPPRRYRWTLALYYGGIVIIEPALEKLYDDVLPQIDRAVDR